MWNKFVILYVFLFFSVLFSFFFFLCLFFLAKVYFNGAETNCGIARILGILLMNSCDT